MGARTVRAGVVALLLLLCLSVPAAHAIQTEIAAGEVFTVTEAVPTQTMVTVQFHIAADQNALNVRLENENGATLHSWQDAKDGVYTVEASDKPLGLVLTLDNSGSRFSSVPASFYITKTSSVDSKSGKESQLDPIENKVRTISASLNSLQTLQIRLRNQQKDHRATVEDANERVLLWSVFQVLALVGMSAFQMFFLKRFLEKRTVV